MADEPIKIRLPQDGLGWDATLWAKSQVEGSLGAPLGPDETNLLVGVSPEEYLKALTDAEAFVLEPSSDFPGQFVVSETKGGVIVTINGHRFRTSVKQFNCALCGMAGKGYGHNPAPVLSEGKVCDDCNRTTVLPIRLEKMTK